MKIRAFKTDLKEILSLRALFLQENNFQIRYNACHERGWSDSYLLTVDELKIGYGSIKGKDIVAERDAIFEFFVIAPIRKMASVIFSELLTTSGADFIECQSYDFLLSSMIFEYAQNINSDVILFEDSTVTEHTMPEVFFRRRMEIDIVFEHKVEPVGDYILEKQGEVVATGGFMLHYNMPFADLYMEVRERDRGTGLGSFLIQELKKECWLSGRVPAARCSIQNHASRATLIKAGLKLSGHMLTGKLRHPGGEIQ